MFNHFLYSVISLFGRHFYDLSVLFLVLLTIYWYASFDLLRLLNIKKSLIKLNSGIISLKRNDKGNILKMNNLFDTDISSGLKNAWAAYCRGIKQTISEGKLLDIKEYFNLYSIITIPARRKRAEAIPGILSITGIIGTFLGIMSGLSKLDLASGTKDGMNSFLDIIAASFGVSIAALVLSILFQSVDRHNYHSTVSELNMFLNHVSQKLPGAGESYDLELLIREQRGQKEILEKMGVNISAHLSTFIDKELVPTLYRSFDEAIKTQIGPSIKAMSDMLCQLSEAARNTQTEGMQIMVDNFTSKLMSTMGLEFEKLGERFKSILEYKAEEYENINRLIDNLSTHTELQKEVNTQTVIVLETIGCYHRQAVEMNASLAENIEKLRLFNDELREILKSDRISAEELNNQRQAIMQENSAYFGKMDEQIHRLLQEMNVQLDAAFLRFNDITSMSFEKLDQSLNSSLESMSDNMKALTENMGDQVRDISIYARGISEEVGALNNRLESAVKEFGDQMNQSVIKTMNTFDDELGEICSRLGRVISDIKDAVEELPVIIETLGNYKKG